MAGETVGALAFVNFVKQDERYADSGSAKVDHATSLDMAMRLLYAYTRRTHADPEYKTFGMLRLPHHNYTMTTPGYCTFHHP